MGLIQACGGVLILQRFQHTPWVYFLVHLFQGHDGSSVNPGGRKEKPVGEVQPAPRLKSPENVGSITGGNPGTSGRPQKRSRPSQGQLSSYKISRITNLTKYRIHIRIVISYITTRRECQMPTLAINFSGFSIYFSLQNYAINNTRGTGVLEGFCFGCICAHSPIYILSFFPCCLSLIQVLSLSTPIDATLVADLGMVVIAAKLIFGLDSDFVLKELLSFLEQKKMPSIIYGRKFCPVGLFPAPTYFYWFSMNRQKYTWQGTGKIKVPYSPARWDLVQLMHLSQEYLSSTKNSDLFLRDNIVMLYQNINILAC